jgi:hypothetical protein
LETARATARTLITLTPATPAQNARKISAKFRPVILGEVHTAGNICRRNAEKASSLLLSSVELF